MCLMLQVGEAMLGREGGIAQSVDDEDRLRARVEAELRDQGLPFAIDSAGIGRIAALLGVEDGRKREKRLAAIQQQLAKLEVRWKPADRDEL